MRVGTREVDLGLDPEVFTRCFLCEELFNHTTQPIAAIDYGDPHGNLAIICPDCAKELSKDDN